MRPTVWGRQGTAPRAVGHAPPAAQDVNVVLYIIDTLRADRLGCYGYPRPTSPAVDRLAREGVLFERAIAPSSWTRPAVASILTGEDPVRHGAITLEDAIARIKTETHRLARMQHAWFRDDDARIAWLDAATPDLLSRAMAMVAG